MSSITALKNKIGFVGGLIVFFLLLFLPLGLDPKIQKTLAVLALCAVWWGTEAVSIYATSLVPAVLLPMLGIMPLSEALSEYANRLVFLFLGGFIIARSMMKWGIDRRLALAILGRVGGDSRMLVLYFMGLTAVLSAFLSNTATTAMMLPIALAVLTNSQLSAESRYGTVLLLGIAYAATIGGVATLVGTRQKGKKLSALIVPLSSGVSRPSRPTITRWRCLASKCSTASSSNAGTLTST